MGLTNRPKWALTAAAAITLGITGVAMASGSGDSQTLPEIIDLQDRVTVTATAEALRSDVDVVPGPLLQIDDSHDSVNSVSIASPDSADSFDTVQTVDSAPSIDSADSPDAASTDSADSPDSVDSADSVDSF